MTNNLMEIFDYFNRNLGGIFRGLFWGGGEGGGGKIIPSLSPAPCLKLVRIMLNFKSSSFKFGT